VLGCEAGFGEITIVQGWDWYAGANSSRIGRNEYDFETVVTHELGHALGLEHTEDFGSVMYPSLGSGMAQRLQELEPFGVSFVSIEPALFRSTILGGNDLNAAEDRVGSSEFGTKSKAHDLETDLANVNYLVAAAGLDPGVGSIDDVAYGAVGLVMDDLLKVPSMLDGDRLADLLADLALVVR
jgi:hypothetical protein